MKPKQKPGDALVIHAHGRSGDVRKKIQEALKTIELNIEQNDAIYPLHGGRVTLAEVCRRAGVHKVTLYGPSHRDTTKPMIEDWLKHLQAKLITGRKVVRKTVTARADNWKERYEAVANKFNEMYAIDVIIKDKKIRELSERMSELVAENLMLRAELSNGKVIHLPDGKEKKKPATINTHAHLILLRGLPGNDKSARVAKLKDEGYEHFEENMFFMKDGKYTFEESMLPNAQDWCLMKTRETLKKGWNVVVANIFETPEDVHPYVLLGYPWEIIEVTS